MSPRILEGAQGRLAAEYYRSITSEETPCRYPCPRDRGSTLHCSCGDTVSCYPCSRPAGHDGPHTFNMGHRIYLWEDEE
jgi:hypothetical protein